MSPWLYGIGGAALFGVVAGWTVRDWKADSDALAAQTAAQERYDALAEENSKKSLAYETLAQSIRQSERRDRVEIREIFRDVETPSDCAVPDSAIGVLDNAVNRANAAATGQPIGPMPDPAESPAPIE